MRIALITFDAHPERGGAERYTVDLASALTQHGHRVSLISARGGQAGAFESVLLKRAALTRAGRYIRFLKAVDRYLTAEHFDIVHAMLPVLRCDVYQPHAGLAMESVETGHQKRQGAFDQNAAKWANRFNAKRQRYAAVERQLLSSADPPAVICLSERMKSQVLAHVAIDPQHLVTIYNAVDLARFDPAARPTAGQTLRTDVGVTADQRIALFIGQDFARKGLAQCIAALAEVNDPRLLLLVAGADDRRPYLQQATKLAVNDRVRFLGAVADPYPLYRAAHFVLFPSHFDPFGLVPIEAVAMGVPVILSRQAGASEVIENGQQGIIVEESTDVPAIAAAIRRLIEPAERQRMSENCLSGRKALSYDRHLEQIARLYAQRRRY